MAARNQNGNGRSVKRVALPDGKSIEVVYFEDGSVANEQPVRELHVCPACESRLVYPTSWSEADKTSWEVTLRCPSCEWSDAGIFDQETVERFDEELDRGTDELVDDLRRLVYANMEEQIDRFCDALQRDLVLPEDF
jgi:hypothetical protein